MPRGKRLSLAWRRALFVSGVGLMFATALLAFFRFHVPAEKKEILYYFEKTYPPLHDVTKGILQAMAGLVDEQAPSAELAVELLDQNILPSTDYVLESARVVELETIAARALHRAYIEAVEAMRGEALAMRALFADPALSLDDKRRRARERLLSVTVRFEAFYARAAEVWREHGIAARP